MFHTGKQIARVTNYVVFPFSEGLGTQIGASLANVTLGNVRNEHQKFAFLVPENKKPHSLLTDLKEFYVNKKWFQITLEEKNRMLSIISINEPDLSQEEIEALAVKETRRIQ